MKTITITDTEAQIVDDAGTCYTLRGDQLEKHRAMFPEIEASGTLKAKADALKLAKLDAVGRLVDDGAAEK